MNRRLLAIIALIVLDIPLYLLIFRALFHGSHGGRDSDSGSRRPATRQFPKLGDFLDPEFMKDGGGETKALLFLFTAALLVLIEYSLVLHYIPGLFR